MLTATDVLNWLRTMATAPQGVELLKTFSVSRSSSPPEEPAGLHVGFELGFRGNELRQVLDE